MARLCNDTSPGHQHTDSCYATKKEWDRDIAAGYRSAAGEPEPVYTREQVSTAVNWAADQLQDDGSTNETIGLLNLMVNAALGRLDHPDADLDAIISAQYEEGPGTVRSWVGL